MMLPVGEVAPQLLLVFGTYAAHAGTVAPVFAMTGVDPIWVKYPVSKVDA